MANLYYTELLQAGMMPGQKITITGDAAHHAVTVARTKPGQELLVSNGCGLRANVTVVAVTPGKNPSFTVQLQQLENEPLPAPELVIAQALPKGERAELAIAQCTEAGVHTIIPWQAVRSVAKWQDAAKSARGVSKWQRAAQAAAQQSLRARIPNVADPHTSAQLAQLVNAADTLGVVLDPWADHTLSALIPEQLATTKPARIVLIIGPEGGISEQELHDFTAMGAVRTRLGKHVLRTSSAGLAALAALQTAAGLW